MKPCIFLDIDGVINPSRKKNSYCLDYNLPDVLAKKLNHPKIATLNAYLVNQVYYCFSKESIQLLKQLIEKYDAQIIITSSWRIVYSLEQLQAMFDIFDLGKYVKSVTTLINPRTKAIQEFINENNVTSYIILDDFDMSNAFDYHFMFATLSKNPTTKRRTTLYLFNKRSFRIEKTHFYHFYNLQHATDLLFFQSKCRTIHTNKCLVFTIFTILNAYRS